jgi:hypothetical protein
VSEEDLCAGRRDEPFLRLMGFEAERARAYYNESRPLLDLIHPRSRASLWALISIYSRLLERIEGSNYDVFRRRGCGCRSGKNRGSCGARYWDNLRKQFSHGWTRMHTDKNEERSLVLSV